MRILMATGGSVHSEAALRFGAHILSVDRRYEAPTIITVVKHEAEQPQADAILAQADQLLKAVISNVQTKVRIGHPAEEIIREAEEGRYNLVIVGEKQHPGLVTRFLLGSTAVRVVEHAPCPVIIAKGKNGPIRRILLCDSGIEQPSLLSRFTAQCGDLLKGGEEVIVLHVMSQMSAGPGVSGKQLRAEAEELIKTHAPEGQLLERDIQLLEQLNVQPQPRVRHGLVVDEILAEARNGAYDLVVIGAHQGQGWRSILLDDLAHQIIGQMDRPILIVR
jgi:nucleotide-binding universal stress UspA family protein